MNVKRSTACITRILTAVQPYRHRGVDPDVQDNGMVRLARRAVPITDDYEAARLLVRRDGRRMATPLFLVLIAIGSTHLLAGASRAPAERDRPVRDE